MGYWFWIIEDPTAGILMEWDALEDKPHFSWSKERGEGLRFVSVDRALTQLDKIIDIQRYQHAFVRTWRRSKP